MLHSNTTLHLEYLTTTSPGSTIVSNYIQSIRKLGTREDVSILMAYYHQNPTAHRVGYILSLLYDFGTLSYAEDLWNSSFENERLKPNYSEEILHLLGYLGLQKSISILLDYALHSVDYGLNKNGMESFRF